jgi:hypothetical protein
MSQDAAHVKAQHERLARKDTKSIKEIHAHLNLQTPHSPIAYEGEECPKIESFEERMAHFDMENPLQSWYRDISFGGFSYGFDSGVGTSHTQPPPFSSPPRNDKENEESGEESEDGEYWSQSCG